jgi:hypothetical protein
LDKDPTTETRAAAGTAMPETVQEPRLPESVSPLRQKLGQKAKQEPQFRFTSIQPDLCGTCACLRRELSGEPDAGNLHLRFDEGGVGRASASPSLLLYRLRNIRRLRTTGNRAVTAGSGESS